MTIGGEAVEIVGAGGAAAVALSVLSITSTMQLRVELRAVVMTTGFRSLVLLVVDCLELQGCIPLANLASNLCFQCWPVLLASLPVIID